MAETVKTIEHALDMTGFSHYNLYLFLLFGWCILSMTFEFFGFFYIMGPMSVELGVTDFQLGVINQMVTIGLFLSANKWGYASDTVGRKKTLKLALTTNFVFGACVTFSPHWIVFAILKCIAAISVAGIFVAGFPLLIECTPFAKRRTVIILSISTFLIAFGTMSVLSFPLLSLKFSGYVPLLGIYFNSWRLTCLLFALPSLFGAIAVGYIFESPKYLLAAEKEEESLEVLRGIFAINNRRNDDIYKVETVVMDEDNVIKMTQNMSCLKSYFVRMMTMMKKPRTLYFTLLLHSQISGYICIYCYIHVLPIIASAFMSSKANGVNGLTMCETVRAHQNTTAMEVNHNDLSSGLAMTIVFAVGIGLAILNVIINGLVNYINRKKIVLSIQILLTIAAISVNFSPYGVLTAILFMFVLCGILNVGLLFTYVPEMFLSSTMSMSIGLIGVAGLASTSLFASLIKKFLDSNCEVVFYIVPAVSVFSMIFTYFLPSDETLFNNKKAVSKTEEVQEENET